MKDDERDIQTKRELKRTRYILPMGREDSVHGDESEESDTGNVTQVTRVTKNLLPDRPATKNSCLVVLYPPSAVLGRKVEISSEKPLVIGRHPDCELQLNDDSVSRRHAMVEFSSSGCIISDLGSTNGTYLNESVIRRKMKIENGAKIRIGQVLLKFLSGEDVEAEYHDNLYKLTIIDALTDAYNKRYLMEYLTREIERLKRNTSSGMSLLMIDIDHFKVLNDNFGHLVGDLVLKEVASRIRSNVRKNEIFARYGGEEFTVCLPDTNAKSAFEIAERIRNTVCSSPVSAEGNEIVVTISLGICTTQAGREYSPEEIIQKADENLYRAKRAGRNKTVMDY
ncbi:MAG: GGDEF domain-containing protein [Deltaproteobacteria bacterium]|nr:GGDEF domain-containing protein [Deltaproteobacteria bacterium]